MIFVIDYTFFQSIIFTNKRVQNQMKVYLKNNDIPNKNTIKILEIHFDKKKNWVHYTKVPQTLLTKSHNIMKMFSYTTWRGDEQILI